MHKKKVKRKVFRNNTYEESEKGDDKIKKIIQIGLIFIISINYVSAEEYPEITNDSEVRYRWYKETITGGKYIPVNSIQMVMNNLLHYKHL